MTLLQCCTPIVLRVVIPRSHCYPTKFRDGGNAPISPMATPLYIVATSRGIRKQNSQSEQTNEWTKYSRPTINQRNIQKNSHFFTWPFSSRYGADRAKNLPGQPPRMCSECFRFYPNRFTLLKLLGTRKNEWQTTMFLVVIGSINSCERWNSQKHLLGTATCQPGSTIDSYTRKQLVKVSLKSG